jgi:hypothetical protein
LCSGEYNPACEGAVSPTAADLDWSPCDPRLKHEFDALMAAGAVMSSKDREAASLGTWRADPRAGEFTYGAL